MAVFHRFEDADQTARALSEFIVERALQWVEQGQPFSLALAGGSTPALTYRYLSHSTREARLEDGSLQVFWSDERCVPPQDERSNFRMASEIWLAESRIPAENIYPVICRADPDQAAETYAATIRAALNGSEVPEVGLVLLGLGEDGHTASLFPGSQHLREGNRLVVGEARGPDGLARVSFSPLLINAARTVVFLVTGSSKAEVVRRVIEGPHAPQELPAQIVEPKSGDLHWFLDRAAAQEL